MLSIRLDSKTEERLEELAKATIEDDRFVVLVVRIGHRREIYDF